MEHSARTKLVSCDTDGMPDFYMLMRRDGDRCIWCFDLLALNGRDLRQKPLAIRKDKLRSAAWREANRERYKLFEKA